MTARQSWEPGAGQWVAYRDEPGRTRAVVRHYALSLTSSQSEPLTPQALRFDTKREALEFARAKWPSRVPGYRVGAERILCNGCDNCSL
jgi:hypothetical protein